MRKITGKNQTSRAWAADGARGIADRRRRSGGERRGRVFAAALALLVVAGPVWGYIQNQRPTGIPMRRADFEAIRYSVDSRTAPGLQNTAGQFTIAPESDPLGAIQAAFDAWTNISSSDVRFAPFEVSPSLQPRNDGVSLITFADTPTTRSLVGDAVAVTFLYSDPDGVLTDTDILFNPRLRFSTEPDPSSFDIQGTLTHELGHAIGLDHSGAVGATMFATTTRGTNRIATLSTDDVAFARDLYPSVNAPQAFGEIRGRVTFTFGTSVEGAHVVAVDPQRNVVVAGISEDDGSYRIGGVPAGRYWLYAEPLDGPANRFQLGPARRFSDMFHTNFFGGLTNPQALEIGPGAKVAADLVVITGTPPLNIEGSAAAPAGISEPGGLLAEVQPGGTFDMELYGDGLDNPEIDESSISFLGAAVRVVEGSLSRDTTIFTNGSSYPVLAFRVEVPVECPAGLVSALVTTSSGVAALTGGVTIVDRLPAPLFSSNTITNAASFLGGPVAPGEIVSIFGSNLGPDQGLLGGLDSSGRVVTALGGVTVTFNGLPAPIFFASSGQINVQAPYELAGAGIALVLIQRNQSVSGPIAVLLTAARPGLFTVPLGSAVIATNEDGSLNGPTNGAPRGSFITLYGTGQGQTNPPLGSGEPAGGETLSEVMSPVSVTIGGRPAAVSFAGMTPGFAGLLQVNAVVPSEAASGPEIPIELRIGGVATGQDATISIE